MVWERELDIYGAVKKQTGDNAFIPQRYQGQYVDEETGLAYIRFRYYDNVSGNYISQDPIGIKGGFNLYSYVKTPSFLLDILGLAPVPIQTPGMATPLNSAPSADELIVLAKT